MDLSNIISAINTAASGTPGKTALDYALETGQNYFDMMNRAMSSSGPTQATSAPAVSQQYEPAPTTQTTNVPLYQSAPAPAYTPYQSKEFKFEEDPGYAFRQAQGNKALQAKQLASGNFFSGGALKEAADYNSGLASQEYGNAFSRYLTKDAQDYNQHIGNFGAASGAWTLADNAAYRNNQAAYDRQWNEDTRDYARWVDNYNRQTQADNTNWDRLTYLDQSGLSAAGATSNAGTSAAGNIGNLMLNGGNAQASGVINSNNAWTNALGNALYAMGASGTWNGIYR